MARPHTKVKIDGTISVGSGVANMPMRIREKVGNEKLAYLCTGNVAILFRPENANVADLQKLIEDMQLYIIQNIDHKDTPCNNCLT